MTSDGRTAHDKKTFHSVMKERLRHQKDLAGLQAGVDTATTTGATVLDAQHSIWSHRLLPTTRRPAGREAT